VKAHYFHQKRIDQDDEGLRKAIKQGKVPPGCRLGGVIVQGKLAQGKDPCGSCDAPRDRCGGRGPTDPEVVVRITADMGDRGTTALEGANARKLQRSFVVEAIRLELLEAGEVNTDPEEESASGGGGDPAE
jgi:hypothetical protein